MCLTKARSANLWRQQLLYYTAKLKRHATGCHWEKSKGDHRLLGLNLTTFKVDWMAAFPEWWRTKGSAFCIFISILFLKKKDRSELWHGRCTITVVEVYSRGQSYHLILLGHCCNPRAAQQSSLPFVFHYWHFSSFSIPTSRLGSVVGRSFRRPGN